MEIIKKIKILNEAKSDTKAPYVNNIHYKLDIVEQIINNVTEFAKKFKKQQGGDEFVEKYNNSNTITIYI